MKRNVFARYYYCFRSTNLYIFIFIYLICSCSNDGNQIKAEDNSKHEVVKNILKSVSAKPEEKIKQLTHEQLKKYTPNELGWVMVLEYHRIGKPEARWTRTPDNFRKDLSILYKQDYYLITLRDFVTNSINVPLGKTPIILTFDDATEGQFRYIKGKSEIQIDPDSAVGIIENFCKKYQDFGKGASFYVLPRLAFGQSFEYAAKKLKFLAENGYEIGNHTLEHTMLSTASEQKAIQAIADNISMLHKFLPGYEVNTLAYPNGGVPKNLKIVEKGEFKGTKYKNIAALLVGSEPSVSPNSKKFKPLLIPRIQAIQSELDKYLGLFKNYPDLQYISDGNKDLVTIPKKIHSYLKDTLREDLKNSSKLVTY